MPLISHSTKLYRRWAVWLVVLIAVWGAILPTVAHTLMISGDPSRQGYEICTADGPRWVSAEASASSDDSGSAASTTHCQFCMQPSDRVALINDPLPYPFLFQESRRQSIAWQVFIGAAAHMVYPPPRGPPDPYKLFNS